jgi:hypothetical protein
MNIAQGSLEDCLYYLLLAKDPGYGDTKSIRGLSRVCCAHHFVCDTKRSVEPVSEICGYE